MIESTCREAIRRDKRRYGPRITSQISRRDQSPLPQNGSRYSVRAGGTNGLARGLTRKPSLVSAERRLRDSRELAARSITRHPLFDLMHRRPLVWTPSSRLITSAGDFLSFAYVQQMLIKDTPGREEGEERDSPSRGGHATALGQLVIYGRARDTISR